MQTITAIVETPKGSAQKYDYEPAIKLFKLKKTMPAGMVFPFDFGFIPDTIGEDGDPLDIVIISEFKSFFIAIPEVSVLFAGIKTLGDLPADIIEQLEKFFMNYNELAEKKFKPLKRLDAKKALKLIKPK